MRNYWKSVRKYVIAGVMTLLCIVVIAPENTSALWVHSLVVDLKDADWTLAGEESGDWTGYFASPAGDVNGDGLGDLLIGAPMAGNKVCPYPLNEDGSCPGLPKGNGVAYLVLGRTGPLAPDPLNLLEADASFLGCDTNTMTARQLYTAGDVNGDGFDDILVSGWKCGNNFTGKAYLFLGREDVGSWGRFYPVEQADASFLGENEYDFLSYYTATAGDVNGDGLDDFLITSTHHEYDDVCPPGSPPDCKFCCKNLTSSSEIYNAVENAWTATGNLSVERMNHAAVMLDGKVLVAGGQNLSAYLSSTEEFDPATGLWAAKGSLITARTNHSMTLLANGKPLVTGGQNETGFLAGTEIYNAGPGTWAETGSLNESRADHIAVLLPGGETLIAGGLNSGGYLASAELYNSASGLWTTTGSLSTARTGHTAVLLANGKVLVAGGKNDGGYLSSAELYDPETDLWSPAGDMLTARGDHIASLLPDGKVLVAGGRDASGFLASAEVYDPSLDTWTETGSLREIRAEHAATSLQDGKILVTGGQDLGGSSFGYEIYDPDLGIWTSDPLHTLITGRANHTAIALPDGTVLAAGGRNCTDFGKTYLILGRQNADWGADFDLANADATFLGEGVEDRLGRSATGVGDVNGDGYEDFLIGAISSDYAGEDAGQNYLFLGRASPGDPDYDPTRPWWGLDFSVAGADASFTGENPGDESGRRVAGAGDVNGDGLGDMLMQAALNDYTNTDAGISYLVLGRSAADWGLRFPLANADASFVGEARFDQSGRRLSGAGDVNGDGYDDFIIGAPHNQDASVYPDIIAGKAYVIFGRPLINWGHYFPLAQADMIFLGKPEIGVAGYDIGWLEDFNADGIDDYFIAAYGGRNNDHVPGEVYVMLGSATPVPVQFLNRLGVTEVRPTVQYTGEYWEPNGWQNLRYVDLILDTESSDRVVVKVRYDRVNNKLLLNSGDQWGVETCTPEIDGPLENTTVLLQCKASGVAMDENHTLRATWQIRWLNPADAERVYKVYLEATDMDGNVSGLKPFGTWTLFPFKVYLPLIMK